MIVIKTSLEYLIPVVSGTVLFTLLITFIIYFIVLYGKSHDKFKFEQNLLRQALLHSEIEIKQQTLANVSRELHDNYGQIASLIKINLNLISKEMSPEDQAKVSESILLIKQLIGDIKSLSSNLNGEKIRKIGWIKMIENEVKRVNRIGLVKVDFSSDDDLPAIGHEKEVILYRITQEIFNNLLKHADASKSELTIKADQGKIKFKYSDNGVGFNPNLPTNQLGSGLMNMQERCKMIDATFSLTSNAGIGTKSEILL